MVITLPTNGAIPSVVSGSSDTSSDDSVSAKDVITGTSLKDKLKDAKNSPSALLGKGENDKLIGSSKDDLLDGGDGNDKLKGGGWGGADTYVISSGSDKFSGF